MTDLLRSSANQTPNLGGKDASGQVVSFRGMGFKGISVSDAFWTWGAARDLRGAALNRLMVRSFLAGMDVLMISKASFDGAWDYFQAIYHNQMPAAEQAELVKFTYAKDWQSLRVAFAARVEESWERIRAEKSKLGDSGSFMGEGAASQASAGLVGEYRALTAGT